MLAVYPQTKTYFAHWKDLSPTSPLCEEARSDCDERSADAVSKIDDLKGGLLPLSELHAFTLRVDPANFRCRVKPSQDNSSYYIHVPQLRE
ncbi:hypothetical protein FQN60_003966 [Etheostoma spectabile]|uniref:Globin domain-containing protein n=1 Tax=Etheostoma spectabile TaxID=54343 RepID=A0A5J5CSG9_9PERO|nr:hypothetical protein FQN60_003966 [Etheostoma spectabile]